MQNVGHSYTGRVHPSEPNGRPALAGVRVVDLSQFGVGDYDIYGPKHFEMWERKHKTRIRRGDILVIHTGYHQDRKSVV